MKPNRKYIYFGIAIVLLVILLIYGSYGDDSVKVETGKAIKNSFMASIDAEGRTRYHDRFTITAPVSGKMERIVLHEGDRIPVGYVITRIDPAPPRPIAPGQDNSTALNPAAYVVYSPATGTLSRIFDASERMVEAGMPIAEISKPSRMEIAADVLSADATKIKPGMEVVIANWGGEGELKAHVRTVEPKAFTKVSTLGVEEQRVNIIIDFLNVPEGVGDNFKVDVRIVLWRGENILQVPSSALFRQGDKWAVYAIEGGRAKLRVVETGHRSPSQIEIAQGLEENAMVILHPPNQISEGVAVTADQ